MHPFILILLEAGKRGMGVNNIKSNIAGFLGFLDFKLDKDYGSIEKKLNFQIKEQLFP